MKNDNLDSIEIVNKIDDKYIDWGLKSINAHKVWGITKGEGVKVAIIDTGINANHNDLSDKVKVNVSYLESSDTSDDYGHGTMVSGLIAGEHTGVAPRSELYVSKSLREDGLGSISSVSNGILLAINFKVDILCMSIGMKGGYPQAITNKIDSAVNNGIIVVSATGNDGINKLNYPSINDNIISVGGVDENLEISDFSNFGKGLDVVAPSTNILSTFKDNNYARMTGTSMSAPLVAGGIALIKSYYKSIGKDISLSEIRHIMNSSLDNNGLKYKYGYGVFDLEKIFNYIKMLENC